MVACSKLSRGGRGDAIELLASQEDCSDAHCPGRRSGEEGEKKSHNHIFGKNHSVHCPPERPLDQISRPCMELHGRGLFTAHNLHDSHAVRIADRTST